MTKNQQDAKQAHHLNMINSLEHRLSVARAKGDRDLIEKLEAEKRQYTN
jgi:hypothetical protein